MKYPVVLHTDDGIRYSVTVPDMPDMPDMPGCFSAGETLDEALMQAMRAAG